MSEGNRGERILLMLEHRENRRLLRDILAREFAVTAMAAPDDLHGPFDLMIADGAMLNHHWEAIQRVRRETEIFLPVLLLTGRHDIGFITRHLWRTCDEIIFTPIEKIELRARMEVLLRARRYSMDAEARYFALAESSPVGIFLHREGRLLWSNRALESLLQSSGETLRHQSLVDRVDPGDRDAARECLLRAGGGDRGERVTLRLLTPGGLRWGELYAVPLPHREAGTVLGIVADVTRAREAERLKDVFLARAAHELNTPLSVILGFSEFLLQTPETPPAQRELLTPIHEKAESLARIVEDLLLLSRIQAGGTLELKAVPGDLADLAVRTVVSFRKESPDHHFTLRTPRGAVDLVADWKKLGLALRNLLGNAVKFSPEGSRITVGVSEDEESALLCVEDEGVGMTPEEVEGAREVFYRADVSNTAPGGFGLGLAVARGIATAHGGSLEIVSTSGRGTRVVLRLPKTFHPSVSR